MRLSLVVLMISSPLKNPRRNPHGTSDTQHVLTLHALIVRHDCNIKRKADQT